MRWRLERRGGDVFGLFSVLATDLKGATFPVYVDTAIAEQSIEADADDLYSSGVTYPTGADNAGDYNYNVFGKSGTTYYCAAWRYLTIPIDNAATIDSAAMTFIAQSADTGDAGTTIAAEDVDSAAAIVNISHTPSDAYAVRTTATVGWSPSSWSAESTYSTPDMAPIVQELVDRDGWASNNNMMFLFYASSTGIVARRRPYDWGYNNSKGAKFNCTYTATVVPAGNRFRNTRLRNFRCSPEG
jgi:hypothetical protein